MSAAEQSPAVGRPVAHEHDYSNVKYWEAQYLDRASDWYDLDWYDLSAERLWPLLRTLLPNAANALEVGCGSRPLLQGLHAIGGLLRFGRLLATDISPTIIRRLAEEAQDAGAAAIEYAVADCRRTELSAGSFDLVIDKATCDTLMCDSRDAHSSVSQLGREAARLLRPNGHLVVVTHYQADFPADHPDVPPECNAAPLLAALLAGLLEGAPFAAWAARVWVPDPDDCPRVLIFCKRPPRRTSRGRPARRMASDDVCLRGVLG